MSILGNVVAGGQIALIQLLTTKPRRGFSNPLDDGGTERPFSSRMSLSKKSMRTIWRLRITL